LVRPEAKVVIDNPLMLMDDKTWTGVTGWPLGVFGELASAGPS
jgi:hypothetical protein